jgi:hypothetical protein
MRPLLFAVLIGLLTPAVANAGPEASAFQNCFASTQWRGWSTSSEGDALYLRVGLNDVYRVGLTQGTHVHRYGDRFLVNHVRGSSWICSALDLDLSINDPNGFREPLIARTLDKLSPAEIEALAPRERP